MSTQNPVKETINIFTSVLAMVVFTYFLAIARDSVLVQRFLWGGPFLLLILKLFVTAGMFGQIVQLVSGEDIVITPRTINQNARQFGWVYLALYIFPFFLHAGLFAFFPFENLGITAVIYAHMHIVILYFLSRYMIWVKYLKGNGHTAQKKNLSPEIVSFFTGLILIELVLFYSPLLLPFDFWGLQNGIAFLQEAVHYLQFILITILILRQYPPIKHCYEIQDGKGLYLINPVGGGVFRSLSSLIHKKNPAAFVVLKALTPKDYSIRVFNQYVWRKRYFRPGVLVAITSYTVNSYRAYAIAKGFKEMGAKVVMGGPHAGCLPDEALEFCDSVVIGEAESVWKQLVADYENDCLQAKYDGGQEDRFCAEVQEEILRSPLNEMKDYLEASRGCKYRCDFCAVPDLCGKTIRKKAIDHVIAVIKKLQHRYRECVFLDNNIYSDPQYSRQLFDAMRPLKIQWGAGCSIDIAKSDQDLQAAKESGCKGLFFGYEISDTSDERGKGGKYSMADKYIEYSQKVKRQGIEIRGSFILGWENDTWKSLGKLFLFSFRIRPHMAMVSILTPVPKSQLFQELLDADRLATLNWTDYGFNRLVFKHKHFSRHVLESAFTLYQLAFFLLTSIYGNLYLLLIIYIILLPFLSKNIIVVLS